MLIKLIIMEKNIINILANILLEDIVLRLFKSLQPFFMIKYSIVVSKQLYSYSALKNGLTKKQQFYALDA